MRDSHTEESILDRLAATRDSLEFLANQPDNLLLNKNELIMENAKKISAIIKEITGK